MYSRAKTIANIAISAALLSAVKFALSMIPNIELVTLLILVFASRLKLSETIAITSTFCMIEMLIFGINTWVISYLIYWNLLAFTAWGMSKIPINKTVLMTITAVVMSTVFGVISTLVDTGLFTGFYDNFWERFAIMYVRGGYFYLAQIVSNAIIVPLLYPTVSKVYSKATAKFFNSKLS